MATPDANGEVYRIVKNNPVQWTDMQSHYELGRLPKADACLRCGLSVFQLLEDAIHQQQLMPRLGSYIAKGQLSLSHGKAVLTPGQQPTHTTWWPYEQVERELLFEVL